MEELAKRLGFILSDCDLTDKLLGLISIPPFSGMAMLGFIMINSMLKKTPLERDFTIAHEMGHYYCNHKGDGLFSGSSIEKEWEARQICMGTITKKI